MTQVPGLPSNNCRVLWLHAVKVTEYQSWMVMDHSASVYHRLFAWVQNQWDFREVLAANAMGGSTDPQPDQEHCTQLWFLDQVLFFEVCCLDATEMNQNSFDAKVVHFCSLLLHAFNTVTIKMTGFSSKGPTLIGLHANSCTVKSNP
ncbi:hypothetical protein SERLADRAFT_411060 [Serpula lacrymans var. lacrymans S7.9]|uniref:Uncharacterized protein n=1 Tax=Serpula lacrymans var. lacrymans (strain S7.9) TaxID=578457 RepID=F8P8T8_SERL9|nr:uncharacterized protein SERLADRAFT_411060 [Serpula lacrymans var. lacrymans S7.9]EGO20844.1 hypothetical protein SERLADRAFT_411060 [Serpula lacrymans var. lacrymans S7.9]